MSPDHPLHEEIWKTQKQALQPPPKGKVWKTNGNGELILVDDPDMLDESGRKRKLRKKRTNYTPPKKKRRKR